MHQFQHPGVKGPILPERAGAVRSAVTVPAALALDRRKKRRAGKRCRAGHGAPGAPIEREWACQPSVDRQAQGAEDVVDEQAC